MSLQARILERIQREGAIPFCDYMQMALYEPGYGYYVTGKAKMGWDGDYFTSSDLSDIFAHCLGRQLLQMWQQLGQPAPFHVLEQGAGRGHLAQALRKWAEQEQPALSQALDYQSADIRSGQNAQLAQNTPEPVHVLLSNELIDAFPVHIVEKRGEQLLEVYITAHEGRLQETLQEPSSPRIATYLDDYKIPWKSFPDGWRAEINLAAEQWLAQSIQRLSSSTNKKQGFLLAIDYGELASELYTAQRPRGTLSCYYQHQLTDRPLLRPGEQDITAHVNFSALIAHALQHNLHLHTYTTQQKWLQEMGIEEELAQIRAHDFAIIDTNRASNQGQTALFQWYNLRQHIQTLTDPHGMGNFKVLIMHY